MALAVDPDVVTARGVLQVAATERRSAIANLYTPSVTASTGFTRFSEPFFNFGTGSITPNATSATIEARYSVLGGGKLSERRIAGASVASAEASETAAHFQSALATDAAYYAVLAAAELSRVAENRLARAREQFGVARVRVQAGDALSTDSLQLLLEVSRAQIEVLRGDSALVVSRLQLGRRIGLDGPVDAAPVPDSAAPPLPLDLDQAAAEVLRAGPFTEAARAEERRASAAWSGEREAYLPEISLSATAGTYDSRFFPSALNRSQFSVLVSLPIWNAGRRELQIARARSQLDAATARRMAQERSANEQMAQAFRGYQSAGAEIEFASEGVLVARETYRVQSARYREGAGLITDVLQAQVDLGEAESSLVRARHSARLALARIEALLGRRLFQ
jgi:outer membrane protein TolC